MPDLDLDALRRLANAASPGPWSAYDANKRAGIPPAWSVCNDAYLNPFDHEGEEVVDVTVVYGTESDAAFIAAVRTAVPELIAEVERLRGQATVWMEEATRQAAERDRNYAQLADARHELEVVRGINVDLQQRLDLALAGPLSPAPKAVSKEVSDG